MGESKDGTNHHVELLLVGSYIDLNGCKSYSKSWKFELAEKHALALDLSWRVVKGMTTESSRLK